MLSKLVTLTFLVSIAMAANEPADRKDKINEIFDNDSDFMRGFETGLFLRTKGGTIEEYGCVMPVGTNNAAVKAFETIKTNILGATQFLKLDPVLKEAFEVIVDFLEGFVQFLNILSPPKGQALDYYCTGMIFGLQGSKILVKVANTLGGNKKFPDVGEVSGFMEKMAEGVVNTIKNTMDGSSDEL